MVLERKFRVTVAESWYSTVTTAQGADIIHSLQITAPIPGAQTVEFKTIWIDLAKSQADILQEMNKTTRNEIRRTVRDDLRYDFWHIDVKAHIAEFGEFYKRNAVVRSDLRSVLRWTDLHACNGTLDLSRISQADGKVLGWHVYYTDHQHARLRYSVSLSRTHDTAALHTLIGRANRYLHWEDIKRFKAGGFRVYDLGGWYPGDSDIKLLRVNQFKAGFGGTIVSAFHCTVPLTVRGRVYLWAVSAKQHLHALMARSARIVRGGRNKPGDPNCPA